MHLCSNCAILENEISNNSYGITPSWSNNSIIAGNKVINNKGGGVYLVNSFDFLVAGNVVTSNDFFGIRLTSSSNCTIIENVVANSKGVWIYMVLSNNNIIYHNNFIEHNAHAFSSGSINIWDNGYPSGGNYWSDYKEKYPNATEIDGTGIWDTPYVIDENNQDNYPLIPEFPSFLILLLFMTATFLSIIIHRRRHANSSITKGTRQEKSSGSNHSYTA